MPICDICGNDYDKPIVVTQNERTMTFDSFECAIEGMAPRCGHCGVRVVGHGIEKENQIYCGTHCARKSEASDSEERAA